MCSVRSGLSTLKFWIEPLIIDQTEMFFFFVLNLYLVLELKFSEAVSGQIIAPIQINLYDNNAIWKLQTIDCNKATVNAKTVLRNDISSLNTSNNI